jgi:hypothetical protein
MSKTAMSPRFILQEETWVSHNASTKPDHPAQRAAQSRGSNFASPIASASIQPVKRRRISHAHLTFGGSRCNSVAEMPFQRKNREIAGSVAAKQGNRPLAA